MTNEEWTLAHAEAEKLTEIAKDPSSDAWFKKIDFYYEDLLLTKVAAAESYVE
jgi:hypothetical protein